VSPECEDYCAEEAPPAEFPVVKKQVPCVVCKHHYFYDIPGVWQCCKCGDRNISCRVPQEDLDYLAEFRARQSLSESTNG
jgi:hypothetical protein